jgi:hypothetical protein
MVYENIIWHIIDNVTICGLFHISHLSLPEAMFMNEFFHQCYNLGITSKSVVPFFFFTLLVIFKNLTLPMVLKLIYAQVLSRPLVTIPLANI